MSAVGPIWVDILTGRRCGGTGVAPVSDNSNEDPPGTVVEDFVTHLERNGRSSYTLRSYRQGLGHFARWLADTGRSLDTVRRVDIDVYVDEFRVEEKGGACRVDSARAGQVNPLTRKPYPATGRQQATVNHRLSVLSSFFSFLIERDNEFGEGAWCGRRSPVPSPPDRMMGSHGMAGRDPVRRSPRAELRQRVPRRRPRDIEPALARDLIESAVSARDKAILTLLWRTGQRIGDWDDVHGRHGVLGMALADLDERTSTISVRLKGARDDHRVPVTDDFWPLFHRYLADERGGLPVSDPAWVGLRRGRGRPLSYAAFEASLRYASTKLGANVNAHMFRHTNRWLLR
jgi:integrase/recombinase XerD